MRTKEIVVIDIGSNTGAQSPWREVLVDVNVLGFEAPEPSLDDDIINPSPLGVHALPDFE